MNYIEELQKEEWFAKLPPSTQASIDITLTEVDRRAREGLAEEINEIIDTSKGEYGRALSRIVMHLPITK